MHRADNVCFNTAVRLVHSCALISSLTPRRSAQPPTVMAAQAATHDRFQNSFFSL
jgi:hypothetical protein